MKLLIMCKLQKQNGYKCFCNSMDENLGWAHGLTLFYGAKAPSGPGPPIYRGLNRETDTPRHATSRSVGLLWTGDQFDVENCNWQHTIFTRDWHLHPGGIRTHNHSNGTAAGPHLRPLRLTHCLLILYTDPPSITNCGTVKELLDSSSSHN
jgi:hypothetical protein